MAPIDGPWVFSYRTSIESDVVSLTVFEIFRIEKWWPWLFKVIQGQIWRRQSIARGAFLWVLHWARRRVSHRFQDIWPSRFLLFTMGRNSLLVLFPWWTGAPPNTMWLWSRSTFVPSFISIRSAVWLVVHPRDQPRTTHLTSIPIGRIYRLYAITIRPQSWLEIENNTCYKAIWKENHNESRFQLMISNQLISDLIQY